MAENWHKWARSGFKLLSAPKKAWPRTAKWPRDYKVNVCVFCSRMQPLTSCMTATVSSSQCIACTAVQGSFWGNAQLDCCLCKLMRGFWGPGWCYFALSFRKHTPKHDTIPQHREEHVKECSSPNQSYHPFKSRISKSGFMFPAACSYSLAMLSQPHISFFWPSCDYGEEWLLCFYPLFALAPEESRSFPAMKISWLYTLVKKTPNRHYFECTEHFMSSWLNTIVNHLCKIVICVSLLA